MANKKESNTKKEVKQVGRFGLIGVINTLLDFGLYNLLARGSTVTSVLIRSNIISTTVAMLFSFVANKQFVFKSKGGNYLKQAVIFFSVTAAGLYGLQNGVIYTLTEFWTWPLEFAYDVLGWLKLDGVLSEDFVIKNGAKLVATAASMTWNYFWYKKVVFNVGK